jgi:hypothetical protein
LCLRPSFQCQLPIAQKGENSSQRSADSTSSDVPTAQSSSRLVVCSEQATNSVPTQLRYREIRYSEEFLQNQKKQCDDIGEKQKPAIVCSQHRSEEEKCEDRQVVVASKEQVVNQAIFTNMGAYEPWTFEMELKSLREHVPLRDLMMFVSACRTKIFNLKAHRDEMRLAIEGFRRGAPYSRAERYPVELWACTTNTPISVLLDKMCTSMDLPDRMQERAGVDQGQSTANSDAKRAFDVALQEMKRIVHCGDKRMLTHNEICNRETFEQTHNLRWVEPA